MTGGYNNVSCGFVTTAYISAFKRIVAALWRGSSRTSGFCRNAHFEACPGTGITDQLQLSTMRFGNQGCKV